MVVATGSLPTISMEAGRDDPELARMVQEVFGQVSKETDFAANKNARGGRAFFVKENLGKVVELLEAEVPKDFSVVSGSSSQNLILLPPRSVRRREVYWVVNDTPEGGRTWSWCPRSACPEKWDAANGARSPLFYTHTAEGTKIRLRLEPWDAHYMVIVPGTARQTLEDGRAPTWKTTIWRRSPTLTVKGTAPAAEKQYASRARRCEADSWPGRRIPALRRSWNLASRTGPSSRWPSSSRSLTPARSSTRRAAASLQGWHTRGIRRHGLAGTVALPGAIHDYRLAGAGAI